MAVEELGSDCVLQIGNVAASPTSYVTLEGQVDTTFDGSTTDADTTAKDNAGWETSVATTINGTITCSGTLRTSRVELDKLQAAWVARTTHGCQIKFDAAGNGYKGDFYVTQFNITAPTQDVVRYTITLKPAAALTAIP